MGSGLEGGDGGGQVPARGVVVQHTVDRTKLEACHQKSFTNLKEGPRNVFTPSALRKNVLTNFKTLEAPAMSTAREEGYFAYISPPETLYCLLLVLRISKSSFIAGLGQRVNLIISPENVPPGWTFFPYACRVDTLLAFGQRT